MSPLMFISCVSLHPNLKYYLLVNDAMWLLPALTLKCTTVGSQTRSRTTFSSQYVQHNRISIHIATFFPKTKIHISLEHINLVITAIVYMDRRRRMMAHERNVVSLRLFESFISIHTIRCYVLSTLQSMGGVKKFNTSPTTKIGSTRKEWQTSTGYYNLYALDGLASGAFVSICFRLRELSAPPFSVSVCNRWKNCVLLP